MEFLLLVVIIGAVICVVAWMNVSKRDKRLRDQNLVAPMQYQSGPPVGIPGHTHTGPDPVQQSYTGTPGSVPSASTNIEELFQQVDGLLLNIDDAVKSGQQEFDFASAEFGDAAVVDFKTALTNAKSVSMDAFARRQRLADIDAQMPQLDKQQKQMFTRQEIITLGNSVYSAMQGLSSQVEALQAKRKSVSNLPLKLSALQQRLSATEAQNASAQSILATMSSSYQPAAIITISTNVDQATARQGSARAALTAAQSALKSGVAGDQATEQIQLAEQAIAQSEQLLLAVIEAPNNLNQAQSNVPGAILALQADAAQARAVVSPKQDLTQALALADHALSSMASHKDDPLAAMRSLTQATETLEAALASSRSASEAAAQAGSLYPNASSVARSEINLARNFIETRRGGVGADARAALSEAERTLGEADALRNSDPASAVTMANRATQFARDAQGMAQNDVAGFGDGRADISGNLIGSLFGPGRGFGGGNMMGGVGGVFAGLAVGSLLPGGMQGVGDANPGDSVGNLFDGVSFDGIGDGIGDMLGDFGDMFD